MSNSRLNVFECLKMTTPDVIFQPREEKSNKNSSEANKEVFNGVRATGMLLLAKNLFTKIFCVAGRIIGCNTQLFSMFSLTCITHFRRQSILLPRKLSIKVLFMNCL